MELILLENIIKLGNIGDKVEVKPGYGRNYLLKTGKALRFSKENLEYVSKKKDELNKKNIELKKKLKEVAQLINKKSFVFNKESKENGELYGSIKPKEITNLIKDKKEILLPRKEFELLFLLATKPEKVFTREEIMNKVWGTQVIVGDRTIDVHVRKLREKIGEKHIKTLKGVGYKFKS